MQYTPERNQGFEKKQILVHEAERAMENFKNEVADDLGYTERIKTVGFHNMYPRECGQIGGNMVRRMIELVESDLASGGKLPQ